MSLTTQQRGEAAIAAFNLGEKYAHFAVLMVAGKIQEAMKLMGNFSAEEYAALQSVLSPSIVTTLERHRSATPRKRLRSRRA
jgi:hypothetical protein